MKRLLVIGIAVFASAVVMALPASARLGMAPSESPALQDDLILAKGGHGHGHGHMGRGGRGHHYGWGRGRGRHLGWRHHR
jgi:hypothetical protein